MSELMVTDLSVDRISSHVDVAPIEYVTKYSINRNFLKLVKNDEMLSGAIDAKLDAGMVHSFVDGKTYTSGDCVFYKVSDESQSLYLLCCDLPETSAKPTTIINKAGDEVVKNSDAWKLVGIPAGEDISPRDQALEYVNSSRNTFLSVHQLNTDLSAHPTRELGMQKSTITFRSLENIQEGRQTFFYPNQLKTLNPDSTVIAGYMRKWENGLLEYDVIFRVGSRGEFADDGQALISANNLDVYHRNQNFLYFKDNADFQIFNKKSDFYVTANGTKQVNLSPQSNAYYGEITFPEEFKDLNYMVFTSQVKNVETEAKSIKNQMLTGDAYDKRLVIDGLTIADHDVSADYEQELKIPTQVVNISKYALAYIEETNALPVKITIDPDSDLVNIGDRAFEGTAIKSIVVPKHVKCLGANAFTNCTKLEVADIWVNKEISKQLKVDFDAFEGASNLSTINLHYFSDTVGFAATPTAEERISAYASDLDLSSKMCDVNFQKIYGINVGTSVTRVNVIDESPVLRKPMMLATAPKRVATQAETSSIAKDAQEYSTVNVSDFLASLDQKSKPMMKSAMLGASPIYLSGYFNITDNTIVGVKDSIDTYFSLDFANETMVNIKAIAAEAFKDCQMITDMLVVGSSLTSIGPSAFYGCENMKQVLFNIPDYTKFKADEQAFDGIQLENAKVIASSSELSADLQLGQVDKLELVGNGVTKLLPGISATAASLVVKDFKTLASSSLENIGALSATIKSGTPGLQLEPYVFQNVISAESGHKRNSFQQLTLDGNSITCETSSMAFTGVFEPFKMDLTNTKINPDAFRKFNCTDVKFSNWRDGVRIETAIGEVNPCILTAFAEGAFNDCNIERIQFMDLTGTADLEKTLIVGDNFNVVSASEGTILRTQVGTDPAVNYGYTVYEGKLVVAPQSLYLHINADYAIVSCNWDAINALQTEISSATQFSVPFGVKSVLGDAFNKERPDWGTSSITKLSFPITLKRLEKNAFKNIPSLETLEFERGTDFEFIGQPIFDSNDLSIGAFEVLRDEI